MGGGGRARAGGGGGGGGGGGRVGARHPVPPKGMRPRLRLSDRPPPLQYGTQRLVRLVRLEQRRRQRERVVPPDAPQSGVLPQPSHLQVGGAGGGGELAVEVPGEEEGVASRYVGQVVEGPPQLSRPLEVSSGVSLQVAVEDGDDGPGGREAEGYGEGPGAGAGLSGRCHFAARPDGGALGAARVAVLGGAAAGGGAGERSRGSVGSVVFLGDSVVSEVVEGGREVGSEGGGFAFLEAEDVGVGVGEDLEDPLESLGPGMGTGVAGFVEGLGEDVPRKDRERGMSRGIAIRTKHALSQGVHPSKVVRVKSRERRRRTDRRRTTRTNEAAALQHGPHGRVRRRASRMH